MSRLFGALVISISLLAPVSVVSAQDHDHDQGYGSTHPRTHEWNDREDRSWHQYLKEEHRHDHDWAKASKREQRNYWKWRDQHPDPR